MSDNSAQTPSEGSGSAPPAALAPIFDIRSSGKRSRSTSKFSLKFPEHVPSAVISAIENYEPREGLFVARPSSKNPSVIHFWGVRLDTKPEEEWAYDEKGKPVEREQYFSCQADEACRNSNKMIKITSKQTSSATVHLDKQHNIKSSRTQAADEK